MIHDFFKSISISGLRPVTEMSEISDLFCIVRQLRSVQQCAAIGR